MPGEEGRGLTLSGSQPRGGDKIGERAGGCIGVTCAGTERATILDQVTAELNFARQMGTSQEGWSSASQLSARQVEVQVGRR